MRVYDEVTGRTVEVDDSRAREYWIVSHDERYAHARADTRAEANRLMLKLGLRASCKVMAV